MTERRRYTRGEKAKAVAVAAVKGDEAAAAELGIPRRTVSSWRVHPDYAEMCLKKREDVAEMFWAAIQIGVDQVAIGLLGDAPLQSKAVALGVLYDKYALLSGEATARTESRALPTFQDHEATALAELAGSVLAERAEAMADAE